MYVFCKGKRMSRFWIVVCLLCLPACQMRMNYPKDIGIDDVQSVSRMVETKPIAFSYAQINLKRGSQIAAYPFVRWFFPNVDIGFFRICNPTLKHRMSRSTSKWTGSSFVPSSKSYRNRRITSKASTNTISAILPLLSI